MTIDPLTVYPNKWAISSWIFTEVVTDLNGCFKQLYAVGSRLIHYSHYNLIFTSQIFYRNVKKEEGENDDMGFKKKKRNVIRVCVKPITKVWHFRVLFDFSQTEPIFRSGWLF